LLKGREERFVRQSYRDALLTGSKLLRQFLSKLTWFRKEILIAERRCGYGERYCFLFRSPYYNDSFVALCSNDMEDKIVVKDSNGTLLAEGDAVLLTKDLKVKGFNKDLKRGTLIKNIRLTDNAGAIEGRVEGSVLVIKTMYLKKK